MINSRYSRSFVDDIQQRLINFYDFRYYNDEGGNELIPLTDPRMGAIKMPSKMSAPIKRQANQIAFPMKVRWAHLVYQWHNESFYSLMSSRILMILKFMDSRKTMIVLNAARSSHKQGIQCKYFPKPKSFFYMNSVSPKSHAINRKFSISIK